MFSAVRTNRWGLAALAFLIVLSLIALLAPLLSPESFSGFNYHNGGVSPQLQWRYLLGADVYGHSVLADIILGSRTTWGVAVLATVVAVAGGALIITAIDRGPSWIREAVGFLSEGGMMLPFLPLVLVLCALEGGGNPWFIGLLMGSIGIPYVVTMTGMRSSVGGSRYESAGWIPALLRYWPSNPTAQWLRTTTLMLAGFLITSTTLDFLGFGVPNTNPSWGNVLSTAMNYLAGGYWWWTLFPGLGICATLVAVTVLGQALVTAVEAAEPASAVVDQSN